LHPAFAPSSVSGHLDFLTARDVFAPVEDAEFVEFAEPARWFG
jgi:hypothetical protein